MRLFTRRQTLHHFKIIFPIPVQKIQNCLKKLQHLNYENTSAVCISFNGHSESPQSCELLHHSILNLRDTNRLSVFSFLEDKATSLTYFAASASQQIISNPYTLIGDVGSTQKTYRNIKKLLDLIGIKYTELGTKSESSQIWNQFVEKSEKEKEITKKWLHVVESNLVQSVAKRRKIAREDVEGLRNKVFHPRDALRLKLIDSVSTFQEFTAVNYPNHTVEDFVYKLDGTRLRSTLTQKELSAIETLIEVAEMPNVALLSSQDLFLSSAKEILDLLQARFQSTQSLEELDNVLEDLFTRLQLKVTQAELLF